MHPTVWPFSVPFVCVSLFPEPAISIFLCTETVGFYITFHRDRTLTVTETVTETVGFYGTFQRDCYDLEEFFGCPPRGPRWGAHGVPKVPTRGPRGCPREPTKGGPWDAQAHDGEPTPWRVGQKRRGTLPRLSQTGEGFLFGLDFHSI